MSRPHGGAEAKANKKRLAHQKRARRFLSKSKIKESIEQRSDQKTIPQARQHSHKTTNFMPGSKIRFIVD